MTVVTGTGRLTVSTWFAMARVAGIKGIVVRENAVHI